MGIKLFLFTLLISVSIGYFIPVDNLENSEVNKDIPMVVFEKPFMYSLDENSVHRIIIAKNAIKFKDRDEMYFADITIKNQDSAKDYNQERLQSDKIIKQGDVYTLTDNVKYSRDNFINLNTQELIFDDKNKIAKNNKPFDGVYYTHYVNGSNLYVEINNQFIQANNTHFEIDVTKK